MENRIEKEVTPQYASIGPVARFFCKIGGSNLEILEKARHEVSRHVGIGAVVLTTAVFAGASMFFAMQTVSNQSQMALLVGVLWALAILNLDRFVVSSYKKQDNKWAEVKVALPRIFLAFLLGATISIPLELKVFEQEIQTELGFMETEAAISSQLARDSLYQVSLKPYQKEKENLEADNRRLQKEIDQFRPRILELEDQLASEVGGKGLSGKKGEGPVARILRDQLAKARKEKERLELNNNPQIKLNQDRIAGLSRRITEVEKPPIEEDIALVGLSAQLDALHRLTEKNGHVAFAYWIFFLLFLSLETAPIFVKLFTPKGSYDIILASREAILKKLQQQKIEGLEATINAERDILDQKLEDKKKQEKKLNVQLLENVADAQLEILDVGIRYWKKGQLKKVRQYPYELIRTNNNYTQVKLEGKTWNLKGAQTPTQFIFRKGKAKNNELIQLKKGVQASGRWAYLNQKMPAISVSLQGAQKDYLIKEFNPEQLVLQDMQGGLELVFEAL